MKWDELGDQQCSIARSSAVLGDRWTLLIISDCFLGVRRFDMFFERLGIPRTTLANRLSLLEEHDVLTAVPYQDNPIRYEYRLTPKGLDLYPMLATLLAWGDKYYSDEAGPPIIRTHTKCGHDFQVFAGCSECGEPVDPRAVTARKRPDDKNFPPVLRGPVSKAYR